MITWIFLGAILLWGFYLLMVYNGLLRMTPRSKMKLAILMVVLTVIPVLVFLYSSRNRPIEEAAVLAITGQSDAVVEFRTLGLPLSQLPAAHEKNYRAALAKFPDLASCLINPDGAGPRLNWSVLRGGREAEVCLFYVSSAIGSDIGVVEWLKAEGFSVSQQPVETSSDSPYFGKSFITARWSPQRIGDVAPFGSVLWKLRIWVLTNERGGEISVTFSGKDVMNTQVSWRIL